MKQTGDDMPDPREWTELFANNAWGPGDVRELIAACYRHAASVAQSRAFFETATVAELKRLAAEIERGE